MVNGQNPNLRGERTLTLLSPQPQEAQHRGLGLSCLMAAQPAVCSCSRGPEGPARRPGAGRSWGAGATRLEPRG